MSASSLICVLSGPTNGGKNTLIREIAKIDKRIHVPISYTTRKPLGNEVHGMDYYFITRKRFIQMIKDKEFVECALVHGEYYGTPVSGLESTRGPGVIKILEIDCKGAKQIKAQFPDAVTSFVCPPRPVIPTLRKRMKDRGRGESPSKIRQRLKTAEEELSQINDFDCIIINADGKLPDAVKELADIFKQMRSGNRPELLKHHNPTLIAQMLTA